MKKHSLSSLLWGFQYKFNEETDYVNLKDEKVYRQNRLKDRKSLFLLKRLEVLARNIKSDDANQWLSYFDVYRFLYPD